MSKLRADALLSQHDRAQPAACQYRAQGAPLSSLAVLRFATLFVGFLSFRRALLLRLALTEGDASSMRACSIGWQQFRCRTDGVDCGVARAPLGLRWLAREARHPGASGAFAQSSGGAGIRFRLGDRRRRADSGDAIRQLVGRTVGPLVRHQPGLLLTGGIAALIYAYLVRFLAVALQSVSASLAKVTSNMDEAARSLGENQAGVLRRVHFPLLRGSLLSAGLLVFVDVMKELPATLVMRPFTFDTLATQAYTLASDERLAEASTARWPSSPSVAAADLSVAADQSTAVALIGNRRGRRSSAPWRGTWRAPHRQGVGLEAAELVERRVMILRPATTGHSLLPSAKRCASSPRGTRGTSLRLLVRRACLSMPPPETLMRALAA